MSGQRLRRDVHRVGGGCGPRAGRLGAALLRLHFLLRLQNRAQRFARRFPQEFSCLRKAGEHKRIGLMLAAKELAVVEPIRRGGGL